MEANYFTKIKNSFLVMLFKQLEFTSFYKMIFNLLLFISCFNWINIVFIYFLTNQYAIINTSFCLRAVKNSTAVSSLISYSSNLLDIFLSSYGFVVCIAVNLSELIPVYQFIGAETYHRAIGNVFPFVIFPKGKGKVSKRTKIIGI